MLGYHLLGLQLSNEPDLSVPWCKGFLRILTPDNRYTDHNKRAAGWTVQNYATEFDEIKTDILKEATLENQQFLIGPSVCCDKIGFELDDVLQTGWLDQNKDNLAYVAVQQ